jgi:hypothetical protein
VILDALIASLPSRFPDRGMRVDIGRSEVEGDRAIIFPAAHPAVGDLFIWDEGDEATVGIGGITHGHFNPYDPKLSKHEATAWITTRVATFVEDLFADRVLLWSALGGAAGGWKVVATPQTMAPRSLWRRWFVWSGPLPK